LLNAADYGVPQRRVRLFIAGFRFGDAPPFPLPTHSKTPGFEGAAPWVTLGDALDAMSNLAPTEIFRPTGKMAEDLANIPSGSGVKSPGKSERTRPNGHWGYKQGAFVADLSQSARTVTASAQQDWVRDPVRGLRRLAPRECAAIQSFPKSWRFEGSLVVQYRLIGNAVPPLLAEAIGKSLLKHTRFAELPKATKFNDLMPLPAKLADHVRYTVREEASNGQSRREAPKRRLSRFAC
jgi:DNA (cytosine-5)-methyltransferase 1